MTCGVFVIALVGVVVFFATNGGREPLNPAQTCQSDAKKGKYCHAAVASDVAQCSDIGRLDNSNFSFYFLAVCLQSVVKQVFTSYISHSQPPIPDGIHRHKDMEEVVSNLPTCFLATGFTGIIFYFFGMTCPQGSYKATSLLEAKSPPLSYQSYYLQ